MDATTQISTETVKPREPGVYFGLDAEAYHADPSLGSSSERQLATNPSDYWFRSWMNPSRPADKETPATIRGTAVHALVFYGEDAFDRRYMRGADNTDDMSAAEKAAATKAANKRASERGLIALPGQTYDNIAIASAMIAKNPKLAKALTGGLNEVSVFWRDPGNGLPKKARLDCLKPRGVGDLKSLVNKYDKPFPKACIDSVVNFRGDVQACHYLRARGMIPKLVADGCVHGDHDYGLLRTIIASKEWAWQWVWWQAEGAPITYSKVLSPANPLLEISAATIAKADQNYVAYMERFGPDEMWLLEEEPSELFIEDMPPWFARD
jgi:PDDEXK-like domain of unknown function (DUF3799)